MYPHRFTFVCSDEEMNFLKQLANHHRRSQSDVIRQLVRDAGAKLPKAVDKKIHNQKGTKHEHSSTKS